VCLQLPVDRRVPSNWIKINSTKKAIRYHTPEILKNLDKLLLAKEELAVICRSMWHKFLTDFGKYYAQFQAVVESLAALDCLYSLAVLAKQNVMKILLSLCLTCSYVKLSTNDQPLFHLAELYTSYFCP
jgi:DNA mismatch repair ATPase MutS